jgi:hypothetical protein
MTKTILAACFTALGLLVFLSLLTPNTPAIWLASKAAGYNILRLVLMALLAALIITHPPRKVWLRATIGTITGSLTMWTLVSTYQNHMQFLDTFSILLACVAMIIAVLEYSPAPDAFAEPKQLKLRLS